MAATSPLCPSGVGAKLDGVKPPLPGSGLPGAAPTAPTVTGTGEVEVTVHGTPMGAGPEAIVAGGSQEKLKGGTTTVTGTEARIADGLDHRAICAVYEPLVGVFRRATPI